MELKYCPSIIPDKGKYQMDHIIKKLPIRNKSYFTTHQNYEKPYNISGPIPSVKKWNYAKLENPGLNFCFMNSAIQFVLAIEPLSHLLFNEYCKKYSKTESFLSEYERLQIINNQNKSKLQEKEAIKFFIIEFTN